VEVRAGLSRITRHVSLLHTRILQCTVLQLTTHPSHISSRSLRPQLHTMPPRNLLLEHLIHKLMLLDDRQPRKLARLDFDGVHGAAAAADILDL
jgi:hypothetical protein